MELKALLVALQLVVEEMVQMEVADHLVAVHHLPPLEPLVQVVAVVVLDMLELIPITKTVVTVVQV